MIDYYNNETRLTMLLQAAIDASPAALEDMTPPRTREEVFVSRALGLTVWPAISPRTTMEMWLAFIAGDTSEPTAGSYTVRTCAESSIITFARRVRGASAVVPIFPPHTHYERALAKLAGIVPLDWGVLGREWEHLLRQLAEANMPRSAVAIIGGVVGSNTLSFRPKVVDGRIVPGLELVKDDGSVLTVYGGSIDRSSGVLTTDYAMIDMGDVSWRKSSTRPEIFYSAISGKARGVTNYLCTRYAVTQRGSYTLLQDGETCGGSTDTEINIRNDAYIDATAAQFRAAMRGEKIAYQLASPTTLNLSESEVDRAVRYLEAGGPATSYLGTGVWRISEACTITAQISTDADTNRFDISPSASDWTYTISVDGVSATGSRGSIAVEAGSHNVIITATPSPGAGVCIIQPTLFYSASAGLLGMRQDLEEPAEPEEPKEPAEPVEPEPEEPAEPEPEEPEPEEPAEPEPEEPEPEEPEPEVKKRRSSK